MGIEIKIRTNLMCEGCKARITPFLESEERIESWNLDLENENKILSIEGKNISADEVIEIITRAGYQASLVE